MSAHYLFLDVETTGLDPIEDRILELGYVLTDSEFNVLQEASLQFAMKFDWPREHVVDEMHTASGLYEAMAFHNQGFADDFSMIDFIQQDLDAFNVVKPHLAGNSIHFDKSFLAETWGKPLLDLFHHRMLDMSSFRILFPEVVWPEQEGVKHRALPDCYDALNRAKFAKEHIKWT